MGTLVSFAGRVGAWVYIPDYTLVNSVTIKVSHGDATFTNGCFRTYAMADGDKSYNGWHFVGFDKDEFTGVYGTPDWSLGIAAVRLTFSQKGTAPAVAFVDSVVAGWRSKAKLLITADDGYRSWFDYALPVLDSLNLKSTMGIISAQIDKHATWATSSQLAAAYANGHDFAVHGAKAMSDASFTNDADRFADISANRDYLVGRGYTRAVDYYIWPNGVRTLAGAPDQLIALIKSMGFRAARGTTKPGYFRHAAGASDAKYLMPIVGPTASDTLSTTSAYIDAAITYGATVVLMYHDIKLSGATGDVERNMSDLIREMEYVAGKRDAGLIDVVTASQWLSGM